MNICRHLKEKGQCFFDSCANVQSSPFPKFSGPVTIKLPATRIFVKGEPGDPEYKPKDHDSWHADPAVAVQVEPTAGWDWDAHPHTD